MADFDTIGSDTMFFPYTHDPKKAGKNAILVPGEGWLEHARIPLKGKARISSLITIALDGKAIGARASRCGSR